MSQYVSVLEADVPGFITRLTPRITSTIPIKFRDGVLYERVESDGQRTPLFEGLMGKGPAYASDYGSSQSP